MAVSKNRRKKNRKNKGKKLKTRHQLSRIEEMYGKGAYQKTDSLSRICIYDKFHRLIKILEK